MDKQEIIEGDEIIALFMDGVYYEAWGNEAYHSPSPHFYFKDEEEFEKKICTDPKYHSSWDWLLPVWARFWNKANEFCFGAAKAKQYEELRNIRVIFMACIDNGDIANASRIMADSIKWLNSQKQ